MPTFGTALIIIFGNHYTLVGRLLSARPLRWLGLISYSGYLWHQPLLVYLRLRSIEIQNFSHISFFTVAVLLLATLTYFSVERPLRNRTLFSPKHIFRISWIGALLIFLVASFFIRTANNRSLIIDEEKDTYLQDIVHIDFAHYIQLNFHDRIRKYSTFSNQSALTNRRIALIGDSFAEDFMNMIVETNRLVDYEIRCHYILNHCQIYMGSDDRLQWIAPENREPCIHRNHIRHALPLIRQANIIILASRWLEWSAKRLSSTLELLNLTQSQQLFVIGLKSFGLINRTAYTQDIQSDRRIRQDHTKSDIGTLRKSPETLIKPVRSDPVFTGILTNGFRSGFCRKRSDQILSYTVARNHPNRQNPSTRRQRFSQYFDRIPSDFTDKN